MKPEHKHLRRLDQVWIENPIYFITVCTFRRRIILAEQAVVKIIQDELAFASSKHGWHVGRYVIMPDHIHFFARSEPTAKNLSSFMKLWKEWTSKRIQKEIGAAGNIWQKEFFDHLLRNPQSYDLKWQYVAENPVRAGFVARTSDWKWQGEIEDLQL